MLELHTCVRPVLALGAALLFVECGNRPGQQQSATEPNPTTDPSGTSPSEAGTSGGSGGSVPTNDAGAPVEDPPVVNQLAGVTVSTFAGSGVPGSQGGVGAGAGFNNPVGVALNSDGCLIVTEYGGARVRKVTPDGTTTTYPSPGGFVGAFALVIGASGQMFVQTDFDNTGTKTTSSGTIWRASVSTGVIATMATGMGRPRGLAMFDTNTLVVTDRAHHTISLLKPASPVPVLLAGLADVPGMVDGLGTAARFNSPVGVVVMSDRSILVADSANHTVRRITADGTVSTFAGNGKSGVTDGPSASARFSLPLALAIDSYDVVYVSDGGSSRRIRRIKNGVVETVAGSGQHGFADGAGGVAQFYGQEGIAVQPDGSILYVADGNLGEDSGGAFHRVRKIALP